MNVLDNMAANQSIEDKLSQLAPSSVSDAGLERMDRAIDQLSLAGPQSRGAEVRISEMEPSKAGWFKSSGWRAAAIVVVLILPAGIIGIKNMPSGDKDESLGFDQTTSQSDAMITIAGEAPNLTQSVPSVGSHDIANRTNSARPPSAGNIRSRKAKTGDDYCVFLRSRKSNKPLGRFKAIVLKKRRGFSASMNFGGSRYVFKGHFDKSDSFSKVITPENGPSATVELQRAKTPSGDYTLVGTVKRGSKTAEVVY